MNCLTELAIDALPDQVGDSIPSAQSIDPAAERSTSDLVASAAGSLRFFFDFTDGRRSMRDDEGTECESAHDARVEAMRALTALAKDDGLEGDLIEYMVSVRDNGGQLIYRATLKLSGEWLIEARGVYRVCGLRSSLSIHCYSK